MSEIVNVRCENKCNPLNVDTKSPRFSWMISSDEYDITQKSYHIIVKNDNGICWDSKKVDSKQTFGVLYEGAELKSRNVYVYSVEVELSNGEILRSKENSFETVLFGADEWKAKWIEPDKLPGLDTDPLEDCKQKWDAMLKKMMSGEQVEFFDTDAYLKAQTCQPYYPAVMMYRKFTLPEKADRARVYMTACGVYEFYINGTKASDVMLAPEFTSYDLLMKYQVYDVSSLLQKGDNVILVTIADGWYKGKIASGVGCEYGDNPSLLMEMDVTCADGSKHKVVSDHEFLFSYDGPIRRADIYNGQTVDGRKTIPYFATKNMDIGTWKPAHVVERSKSNLIAQTDAPIRKLQELKAQEVFINGKGETIVDFGQNFAGHIRIMDLYGAEGVEIILEHTEELDKERNFVYPFSDGQQKQKDIYILNGNGDECFEPTMTYHGFRYVRITSSIPMNWRKEQFTGIAVGTENERSGDFSCSDERLNQLQRNIFWSQRSNMIGIPTDCPTREKAGWTGDVYVYGRTSCFLQNLLSFYEEWLKSVRIEQMDNGGVQNTVPLIRNYVQQLGGASTGWGDVIVELPWQLYQIYGDRRVLEENYSAMKKWQQYLQGQAQENLLNTGFHFGDWLVPSVKNEAGFADGPASSFLTGFTVATVLYADTTEKLGKIAYILGDQEEALRCERLVSEIRLAFQKAYLKEDGRLENDLQGLYVLALKMNMVPEESRQALLNRLLQKIQENDGCMDCGFMSVVHILDVLSENGKKKEAYDLLFQEKCPSWLYEVKQGATTMWESWNAIREDGSRDGCSFNHYAFGCVGDWIYRNILGIRSKKPGYEEIEICPDVFCGLDGANGYYDSIYGRIAVDWKKQEDGNITVIVQIPANTRATINLGTLSEHVGSGKYRFVVQKC